jgi:hypothetical protein
MKTAFAILIFAGLQSLGAFAQEVTAPPVPPPSCNSPQYNPSLNFLSAPDAAYDEKLTTGSIAAEPPVTNSAKVFPRPKPSNLVKVTHMRKKHKNRKKTSA